MDPRLDRILRALNRHRVALGGLVVVVTLGSMTGGYLRPNGLLEEPKAAQLMSSTAQAQAAPKIVADPFPANTTNRPWVVGTDALKASEPPVSASYDDAAQSGPIGAALADGAPQTTDSAVAEEPVTRPPDA